MSKNYLPKITKEVIDFMRVFASEKRLILLKYLIEKDCLVVWTDIMFDLRLNPKTQRNQLKILQEYKMVEHVQRHGFKVTAYGKRSFKLITGICEEAFRHMKEAGFDLYSMLS